MVAVSIPKILTRDSESLLACLKMRRPAPPKWAGLCASQSGAGLPKLARAKETFPNMIAPLDSSQPITQGPKSGTNEHEPLDTKPHYKIQ